jgi:hypothetical protein
MVPFGYDAGIPVWDRQPCESPKQYADFVAYRDESPSTRTLAYVARKLEVSYARTQAECCHFRWQERAAAWDAYLGAIRQAEWEKASRNVANEHLRIGAYMRTLGAKALELCQPSDIKPQDARKLITDGIAIEQETLGKMADKTVQTANGPVPLERYFESLDREDIVGMAKTALASLEKVYVKKDIMVPD